jgi:phosphoribosylglycinamide formyltransferase-1
MYGNKVHQAVKANNEKETGITIHFVNEHYDEGAQIVQVRCALTANETVENIAQKVAKLEHAFYPKTIEYLLSIQ